VGASCLVGSGSPFYVGRFDAHVADELDDVIRGLAGELGCPGDQQVVGANVPGDGPKRLGGPELETARGLGKPEARPPGDVLKPRLDSRFEQ
jgi:hypothetical protein